MKLYAAIAHAMHLRDIDENIRQEWRDRAEERLERCIDMLPHGRGFDVTPEPSHEGDPLRHYTISGSYHKMDEHGGYDGWADFEIVVKAKMNLVNPWEVTISISDAEEDLRNYVVDTYAEALDQEFSE